MTKLLKVGIVGAQRVGKSTLATELSTILNLPHITEIARKYNVNTTDRREYYDIQQNILIDQLAAERAHNLTGFISDRTTIDNCAYFINGAGSKVYELLKYFYIATRNIQNYSHILYIPIEFNIVPDGFASTDPIYQIKIDDLIIDLLLITETEFYTVSGTHSERIDQALRFIRGEL